MVKLPRARGRVRPPPWLDTDGLHGNLPQEPPPTLKHGLCPHKQCWVKGFAVNITLSADEKIIERARKTAQSMGKSLNQAVRDYLEQLAAGEEGLDAELEALRSLGARCA